jgi:hypothetical protein
VEDHFLVVLKPGFEGRTTPPEAVLVSGADVEGVATPGAVVLFAKSVGLKGQIRYSVPPGAERLHVIVDAPAGREVVVKTDLGSQRARTTAEGTLSFVVPRGAGPLVSVDFSGGT